MRCGSALLPFTGFLMKEPTRNIDKSWIRLSTSSGRRKDSKSASGAIEAAAAVMTIRTRRIPPTVNLCTRDEACDLDYVAEGARPFDGETVLSNSFGFGGQNATLIFGRTR